jgi:hypothetical protein
LTAKKTMRMSLGKETAGPGEKKGIYKKIRRV